MVTDPAAVMDVRSPVVTAPGRVPLTRGREVLSRAAARLDRGSTQIRGAWVEVLINRVAAFALLANAMVLAGSPKVLTPWIPRTVMLVVVASLVAAAVPVLVSAVRGSSGRGAAWGFIAATLLTNIVLTVAPKIGTAPAGTPLAGTTTVIAAGLAAVAFRSAATSYVVLGAVGISYAAVRAPVMGWIFGLMEAGITVLGCSIIGLLVRSLRDTYGAVAATEDDRAATAARTAALLDRTRVRDEWDRLLHDQVLGALIVASRATSLSSLATARGLAGDALRALGVLDSPTRRLTLAELSARRGLTLIGAQSLPPSLPVDVRDAMTAAFDEILANTARHSGVSEVTVSITGDVHGLVLVVTDDGVGFDPTQRGGRFGLARSIPGHLASIGGTSIVHSTPGAGTTVTLSWTRDLEPAPRAATSNPVAWRWGDRRGRTVFITAWVTLHVAIGYLASRVDWSAAHWAVAIALALSVLAGSSSRSRLRWVWLALTAALVATLTLVTEPVALDWNYWFVGITLPLPVVRVMNHRIRQAWGVCTVITGSLLLGLTPHGWAGLWTLREMLTSPWIITVIAAMGVHGLDRALQDLRESTDALVAQRRTTDRLAHRAELDRQRRQQLSRDVIPVLHNIWSASIVTEGSRHEAALVEAGARDRLTGAVLLETAVVDAIRDARARGARVILLADRDATTHPALAAFREALGCLLATCGDGSRLTASWHPEDHASWGTLALTAPRTPVDAACLQLHDHDVAIDQDSDETWIEFLGTDSATPGFVDQGTRG